LCGVFFLSGEWYEQPAAHSLEIIGSSAESLKAGLQYDFVPVGLVQI